MKHYEVTFVAWDFVLITQTEAETSDQAIDNALDAMQDRHGFDVLGETYDATAKLI